MDKPLQAYRIYVLQDDPKQVILHEYFGEVTDVMILKEQAFKNNGACKGYVYMDGRWQEHFGSTWRPHRVNNALQQGAPLIILAEEVT